MEAERGRRETITDLRRELIEFRGPSEGTPTVEQVTALIDNIRSIRHGAFQTFFQQPVIRTGLILLGAIGLSLSEYAAIFS
jgi:hypothetical protein